MVTQQKVLFNGYEFHNRPLKVHFDKFASDYKQPEDSVMDLPSSNVLDSMDILRQTYLPLPSPPQQPPQTTSYPDMYPEYSASLESSLLQEQERQNRLAFINNALALPLQYPGLSTPMYSNSSHSQAPMMYGKSD